MDRTLPSPLPSALADLPVAGFNVEAGTFRDQLGPEPTVLVFLRHFG